MNRSEHLEWCKKRALAYVDSGDVSDAFASMGSDLQKHEGTAEHIGIELGMMQIMGGMLKTQNDMRNFINGFN